MSSLGVDVVPGCLQTDYECFRCPRHRSLRDVALPSFSSVLLEISGSRSFCSGRVCDSVGGWRAYAFFPVRVDSPCAQEDRGKSSVGDPHSSVVAGEVVVPRPLGTSVGDSVVTSL